MRRIKYIIYIVINLFRLPIIKLTTSFRLKCPMIQLISPSCDLEILKNGRINISGRIHTEKNTILSVENGIFECGSIFLNRNSMVVCRNSISIGDGTTIGPNTVIYDHDHDIINRGQMITNVNFAKNRSNAPRFYLLPTPEKA